jgi:hypothetical protein
VKLDANFPDHPKVIAAGPEAAAVYVTGLCLAQRFESDGVVYRTQLERYGATEAAIDRLLEVGLFEPVDNLRVSVHNYLARNRSAAEIAAMRENASGHGARGNHRRWGHHGPFDKCKICHAETPDNPSVVGSSGDRSGRPDTTRSGTNRVGIAPPDRVESPESESESELDTSLSSSSVEPRVDHPDDDERSEVDWRPNAALGILAQRDLDDRQCVAGQPPVSDPDSWLGVAIERRHERHGDELARLAAAEPGWTAEALADAVDPRIEVPDVAAESRARQAEAAAETRRRTNGHPQRDDDRNLRGTGGARASMAAALAETARKLDARDSLHQEAP